MTTLLILVSFWAGLMTVGYLCERQRCKWLRRALDEVRRSRCDAAKARLVAEWQQHKATKGGA